MKHAFEIDWVNGNDWDKFTQNSNQNNVFTKARLIQGFDLNCRFLIISKNSRPLLGFPIIYDDNYHSTFLPYLYYQAPLYSREIEEMVSYRRFGYIQSLTETALEVLTTEFRSFAFKTHHSIADVRPFLRFGKNERTKIKVEPNYTALITPKNNELLDIKREYRKDRRQDLKYAEAAGIKVCDLKDVQTLVDVVRENFTRKGVDFPEYDQAVLRKIAQISIDENFGKIFFAKNQSGDVVGAQFVLVDEKTIHAVATGSCSEHDRGVGSLLVHHCINQALNKNLNFDFNGANSAFRADFKHSFNADLRVYFRLSWSKK